MFARVSILKGSQFAALLLPLRLLGSKPGDTVELHVTVSV